MTEISEGKVNVLKALYESSHVVRMYVDSIDSGIGIPYTILMKSSTFEKTEEFLKKLPNALELVQMQAHTHKYDEALDEIIKEVEALLVE